jgi:outer membrane protein
MRFSSLVGACVLLVSATTVAQAQQKFAYVNSQALMASAPGRTEAEAAYEKEMGPLREKMTKLQDSLQALQDGWAKEEPTLQGAAKEARLKVLTEKQQTLQTQAQKLQEQAQTRQQELMAPIMDGIRKALDDVRAEGGYAFIFDVAVEMPYIVSADKNLDITDRVVAKLRLSAPKAAAPGAKPSTGPATAPAGISTKKPPIR